MLKLQDIENKGDSLQDIQDAGLMLGHLAPAIRSMASIFSWSDPIICCKQSC
jgi:hypothetical protein